MPPKVYIYGTPGGLDFPTIGEPIGSPNLDAFLLIYNNNQSEFDLWLTFVTIIGVFSRSTLIVSIFYFLKPRTIGEISNFILNDAVNKLLNQIFNGKTNYSLLLTQGSRNLSKDHYLETHIPKEMFDYRFLMHPVRLVMMKVLTVHPFVTSTVLKNKLDLSWGEFTYHLTNMKKHNLIRIEDKFLDGVFKQTIIVESEGSSEYHKLIGY